MKTLRLSELAEMLNLSPRKVNQLLFEKKIDAEINYGIQIEEEELERVKKEFLRPKGLKNRWTDKERQFLIENHNMMNHKELVEMLNSRFHNNRTLNAVERMLGILNLSKHRNRKWKKVELQFLRENRDIPVEELTKLLNEKFNEERTVISVCKVLFK